MIRKIYTGDLKRKPRKFPATGKHFGTRLRAKKIGEKDCLENQVRPCEDGLTTPNVVATGDANAKYINHVCGKVVKRIQPVATEAKKEIAEANLILAKEIPEINEKGEAAERIKRYQESLKKKDESRLKELQISLSETKTTIEMVDELLTHHIEASQDTAREYVNKYWCGVLKTSEGKDISYTPVIPSPREYEGRKLYVQRRDELLQSIEDVLKRGGAIHEGTE